VNGLARRRSRIGQLVAITVDRIERGLQLRVHAAAAFDNLCGPVEVFLLLGVIVLFV
jgi:hypothetical protein